MVHAAATHRHMPFGPCWVPGLRVILCIVKNFTNKGVPALDALDGFALLLVDDHPLFRDGLAAALRHQAPGLRVQAVGSPAEALELLMSDGEGFDLVLLPIIENSGIDVVPTDDDLFAPDDAWLLTNPGRPIVAADATRPAGTAYLLSTADRARNVRASSYSEITEKLGAFVRVETIEADALTGRDDVLFYFTGKARVPDLDTLRFRDGAIADHLTSNGGTLVDSPQMSALEWLDAGATASYGTVVEPCAFPQKFPHPGVVIARYLAGETLIEAYWKSVLWPGQGVFVGEPLARPYPSLRFVLE